MRPRIVGALCLLLMSLGGYAQISLGSYAPTTPEIVEALVDPFAPQRIIVVDFALPRVVVGILAGAALGMSGSLFQRVTRNSLASPDILGFSAGAATGAIAALLIIGVSNLSSAVLAATLGGGVVAGVVYGLAGGLTASPRRLIVTGIVVAAGVSAVNSYLLLSTDSQDVQILLAWLAGSLNTAAWAPVPMLGLVVVSCLLLSEVFRRELALVDFADDTVSAVGGRADRLRLAWMVMGIVAVSAATAVTGPIAFVALAAPHIATRLSGTRARGLLLPALVGACLVVWSDVIAAHLLSVNPPAGIVTGALGGLYLLTLLISTAPRRAVRGGLR